MALNVTAFNKEWPRMRTPRQPTAYCVVCRRPIEPGQLYHYVTYKGRKYLHAGCYAEEVRGK